MTFSIEDEAGFNITETAKQVGVVAATLRNWEKEGLFTARRLENGYRIYSLSDIGVLKQIRNLLDQGRTINAVRSFTNPAKLAPPSVPPPTISRTKLAKYWRKSRLEQGHTIDHVASQTDISPSYLHKIETAKTGNISLDVLQRLASFYGEDILSLEEKESDAPARSPLVKSGQGDPIKFELSGVQLSSLTRCLDNNMTIMLYDVLPGHGRAKEIAHTGEEVVYMLSGSIEITLDGREYRLESGDSLHFKSHTSHKWFNNGNESARLLWIYSEGAS